MTINGWFKQNENKILHKKTATGPTPSLRVGDTSGIQRGRSQQEIRSILNSVKSFNEYWEQKYSVSSTLPESSNSGTLDTLYQGRHFSPSVQKVLQEQNDGVNLFLLDDLKNTNTVPKGRISFLEDGKAEIEFFKAADATTAPHELYHLFRRQMAKDATDPNAPRVPEDLQGSTLQPDVKPERASKLISKTLEEVNIRNNNSTHNNSSILYQHGKTISNEYTAKQKAEADAVNAPRKAVTDKIKNSFGLKPDAQSRGQKSFYQENLPDELNLYILDETVNSFVKETINQPTIPKGRISFLEDGKAVIEFFKAADATTAPHELYHLFRRQMAKDAADPNAPQRVKDAYRQACEFVEDSDHNFSLDFFACSVHCSRCDSVNRVAHENCL